MQTYATEAMVASLGFGFLMGLFFPMKYSSNPTVGGILTAVIIAIAALCMYSVRNAFPDDEMIEVGFDNTGGENQQ